MKDVPEIAPEIRGLLEEVVANPRSAIRLAPRRALSTWFDTGETIRATEVSRDTAVRHLVAAYREELAALLREASWISYWKAPGLAHRPIGADGRLYHPSRREQSWRRRAVRVGAPSDPSDAIALLERCLSGIEPHQGWALASASLALVPSDRTRCYLALNVPWNKPRTAIVCFSRLVQKAQPASLRPEILLSLGARTCCLGLLAEARRFYQRTKDMSPESPYARVCVFNLSCFLGEDEAARTEAEELGGISSSDPIVLEERDLLKKWVMTRAESEIAKAKAVSERIKDAIPETARVLCEAFTS